MPQGTPFPVSSPPAAAPPAASAVPVGATTRAASPCVVCEEPNALTLAHWPHQGRRLTMVACSRCGLLRLDPMPSSAELDEFYQSEYRHSYKGVRQPKLKHIYRAGRLAASRLRQLSPHLGAHAHVLDVGCSSGEWLLTLQSAGHQATGIEPDPGYGEFGRQEYGVNIITRSIFSGPPPGSPFDCVTLFHVLEHVPHPLEALRLIHGWTRDNGLLVIEVPNLLSAHQHPVKRFHYAHVLGFTPQSLAFLTAQTGWNLIELSTGSYDRNLLVIARKTPAPPAPAVAPSPLVLPPVTSSAELLRYYLRPTTYLRWLQRLAQFAGEYRAVRRHRSPRALLESTLR